MNTLKTTQEMLKGCGNNYAIIKDAYIYCGSLHFCPSCKSKLQARKQAQEEELGRLNNIHKFLLASYQTTYQVVNEGINELNQSIKLIGDAL